MKFTKAIAAALFVAATSTAFAGGYAAYEYSEETNRATDAENIKNAVVIGTKVDATDYSFKTETSQTGFGNGSISSGIELRVKQNFNGFYVGGRLGEKISSSTHFSHYAIDAGVKFPLVAGLTGDVGYRYRNAFATSNNYETQRGHVAVGYAITKQDAVAVRWSRTYGDEEKDAWRLQYTRSF